MDIIHSIPYTVNKYWYNLFDIISTFVNENKGHSPIGGHIRRVYNNRSEVVKRIFGKLARASDLLYWKQPMWVIIFNACSDRIDALSIQQHCYSEINSLARMSWHPGKTRRTSTRGYIWSLRFHSELHSYFQFIFIDNIIWHSTIACYKMRFLKWWSSCVLQNA